MRGKKTQHPSRQWLLGRLRGRACARGELSLSAVSAMPRFDMYLRSTRGPRSDLGLKQTAKVTA